MSFFASPLTNKVTYFKLKYFLSGSYYLKIFFSIWLSYGCMCNQLVPVRKKLLLQAKGAKSSYVPLFTSKIF